MPFDLAKSTIDFDFIVGKMLFFSYSVESFLKNRNIIETSWD